MIYGLVAKRGEIKLKIAASLLLLFVAYFININLFTHFHIVDGVTIVHSHFHSSSHTDSSDDAQSPAHTKNELTLIKALSDYNSEQQFVVAAVALTILCISWRYATPLECEEKIFVCAHPRLRAPPTAPLIG